MTEQYSPNLKYSKARNLVRNPDTDAAAATRIIRCLGDQAIGTPAEERTGKGSCNRIVVEYGLYADATYHRDGIPEDAMKVALEAGAVVVDALCDHHGGNPYERYAPLIPAQEKDAV